MACLRFKRAILAAACFFFKSVRALTDMTNAVEHWVNKMLKKRSIFFNFKKYREMQCIDSGGQGARVNVRARVVELVDTYV